MKRSECYAIVSTAVIVLGFFWFLHTIDKTTDRHDLRLQYQEKTIEKMEKTVERLENTIQTLAVDLRREAGVLYLDSELPDPAPIDSTLITEGEDDGT